MWTSVHFGAKIRTLRNFVSAQTKDKSFAILYRRLLWTVPNRKYLFCVNKI